jgi:hypothetical protein
MTKCNRCGKEDAVYIANPYVKEINDEIIMEWLCDSCYSLLCDEI